MTPKKKVRLVKSRTFVFLTMKDFVRRLLQKTLGYDNYLLAFSILTIKTLRWRSHEEEFFYFLKIIPDNGIVLDIGANIGVMTVQLARRLPKSQIYSFEPMPNNIRALKKVIGFYKLTNVKVVESALGDETGEIKMVLPVINNTKMQGLSHVVEADNNADWNTGELFTVPVITLDSMAELQGNTRITAIKIDVENFEYYVLKGGVELLKKHKPVIYCELWDNEKRKLSLDLLKSIGYDVKIYNGKKLKDYQGESNASNFFLLPRV